MSNITSIEINQKKIALIEVPDWEHPQTINVPFHSATTGNYIVSRVTANASGYYEAVGRGRDVSSWVNVCIIRNEKRSQTHEQHSENHNHTLFEKVLKGDILEYSTFNLQNFTVKFYPLKEF